MVPAIVNVEGKKVVLHQDGTMVPIEGVGGGINEGIIPAKIFFLDSAYN